MKEKLTRYRSSLIIALVTLIAVLSLGGYGFASVIKEHNTNLANLRQIYMAQFDRQIQQEVQIATAVLEEYHQKEVQGELTLAEAQKQAAAVIRGLRYGKDGYFWVDTTEGMNIVNLGKSTEGKSRWDAKDANGVYYIQEITKHALQEGGGYTEYSFPKPDDKSANPKAYPKRSYSLVFKPWNWVVGTGNYYDDIDEVLGKEKIKATQNTTERMVISSVIGILVLFINLGIAWFLNRKTQRDVRRTTQFAGQLAEGNFQVQPYRAGGEMKAVSEALARTVESLRALVAGVKESIAQVSVSAEGLNAGAEQAAQASMQVAGSMSVMVNTLEQQLQRITKVAAQMQKVSEEALHVESQSQEAMNRAKTSEESAQTGRQAVEHAIRQMGLIQESVEQTAKIVIELERRSQEIGNINQTITDVAEQTNLLALNAAIEAARAGEHGRGFSVVADEVRKLADESRQAAQRIADLIQHIQEDTQRASLAMSKSTHEVLSGHEIVGQAGTAFVEIVGHIHEVSSQIQKIANESSEIRKAAKEVAQSTQDMREQNTDLSAETQSISAATEQQSASTEEIAGSSQVLATMAEELQTAIAKFKV